MMIVNGSPRAPKSNSKQYAALFKKYWKASVEEYEVTSKKHQEACKKCEKCSHLLLVFPLYVDSLPVTLMHFLKELQRHTMLNLLTIHVLINCGFLEPEQNSTAVDMVRLFCSQNGFCYGSTLCIGGGEAILHTPFVFLVRRKLKKLAASIRKKENCFLKVTMPISKQAFLKAAEKYWITYGAKFHTSREQMDTMEIESQE